MAMKNFSIRIDDETLDKLHYISDFESRSINGQITVLVRDLIIEFEEKHGEIPVDKNRGK